MREESENWFRTRLILTAICGALYGLIAFFIGPEVAVTTLAVVYFWNLGE